MSTEPMVEGRSPSRLKALLRRRGVRPALTVLAAGLFAVGGTLIVYPLLTHLYSAQAQRGLEEAYDDAYGGTAQADEPDQLPADYDPESLAEDDPLTRMVIPALDVDTVVVAGISQAALRAGAGHYPDTPLPGEEGNVAIAGHRTTYGAPLRDTHQLASGDEIRLETPVGVHTYEVVPAPGEADGRPCPDGACWITDPHDWSVVDDLDGHYLTLTTCHPLGSDAERLIVRAELVDSEPPQAADAG